MAHIKKVTLVFHAQMNAQNVTQQPIAQNVSMAISLMELHVIHTAQQVLWKIQITKLAIHVVTTVLNALLLQIVQFVQLLSSLMLTVHVLKIVQMEPTQCQMEHATHAIQIAMSAVVPLIAPNVQLL